MPTRLPKISIIGAGTVGSTLALALYDKGYPIISIISRTGSTVLRLGDNVKCKKISTQVSDIAPNTDIIFITVSDGAIEKVAIELSKSKKLKFKDIFVVHVSGVHSTRVLESLRKKGVLVGSIHPIQSFPSSIKISKLQSKLKGIYYGVEGNAEAIKKAEEIVENLGGHSIIISKDLKPLYHVACVFSSNYMTMFLNTISELSKSLKLKASWAEVFGPLMMTTMENVIQTSPTSALTGPIIRGDLETLDLHLKILNEHTPQFLPIYTIGGIEVARIAKEGNKISQEDFKEIISKFRKFIKSSTFKKSQR